MRRIFNLFQNAIEQFRVRSLKPPAMVFTPSLAWNPESRIKEAAQSAVLAGIKILADIQIFNNTYMRPFFDHIFEVGIGVHVGKVICGNVGIGLNNNLTVMGYPVNIAARLQGATKEVNNSFVISENAFQLLKKPPYVQGCANLNLKGVSSTFAVRLIGKPYQAKSEPVLNH